MVSELSELPANFIDSVPASSPPASLCPASMHVYEKSEGISM